MAGRWPRIIRAVISAPPLEKPPIHLAWGECGSEVLVGNVMRAVACLRHLRLQRIEWKQRGNGRISRLQSQLQQLVAAGLDSERHAATDLPHKREHVGISI